VLQVDFTLDGGPELGELLYLLFSDTIKDTFLGCVRVLPMLWLLRVEQQVMTCLLLLLLS
jgi:hypothetical protein